MPWISQAIYNPGDIIQVDSYLAAHHKGHFEVKGCPLGRESSQECFDAYPLEFVEDLLFGMPKDQAHPGRGYLHGTESRLSMQFRLPAGLVGEQVLLQVRTHDTQYILISHRSFYKSRDGYYCISLECSLFFLFKKYTVGLLDHQLVQPHRIQRLFLKSHTRIHHWSKLEQQTKFLSSRVRDANGSDSES